MISLGIQVCSNSHSFCGPAQGTCMCRGFIDGGTNQHSRQETGLLPTVPPPVDRPVGSEQVYRRPVSIFLVDARTFRRTPDSTLEGGIRQRVSQCSN